MDDDRHRSSWPPPVASNTTSLLAASAVNGAGRERAHDASRRRLGLLYALNTLGSVGGTLVATFVAIEALGIQATLWSAVAVNLVVAGVALWQAPRWPAEPAAASTAAAGPSDRPPKALVLAGAAGSGLCLPPSTRATRCSSSKP